MKDVKDPNTLLPAGYTKGWMGDRPGGRCGPKMDLAIGERLSF